MKVDVKYTTPSVNISLTGEETKMLREFIGNVSVKDLAGHMMTKKRAEEVTGKLTNPLYNKLSAAIDNKKY